MKRSLVKVVKGGLAFHRVAIHQVVQQWADQRSTWSILLLWGPLLWAVDALIGILGIDSILWFFDESVLAAVGLALLSTLVDRVVRRFGGE